MSDLSQKATEIIATGSRYSKRSSDVHEKFVKGQEKERTFHVLSQNFSPMLMSGR